MSIDYTLDLEDFQMVNVSAYESVAAARAGILETFEDCQIEVPAADMTEEELLALPGHVLFGYRYDRDLSLSVFAIPESKLSEALAAAFVAADGRAYEFHEMSLGNDLAKAFVRIDTAMGTEGFDKCIEGFVETIDDGDKDCLAVYRIAFIEDEEDYEIAEGAFDKRFVASYEVQRVQ